jgi:hypothetical protein
MPKTQDVWRTQIPESCFSSDPSIAREGRYVVSHPVKARVGSAAAPHLVRGR